jgi:hypothetical protein
MEKFEKSPQCYYGRLCDRLRRTEGGSGMRVKIIRKNFGGVEFGPEMRVLHLGGQSSANVERLKFELPQEWAGCAVTLHIQRQDGTLPTPILLDEEHSAAVGKEFTASPCGSWMLLALGEDGYRALTRPARYDCYETLNTDGDAEISPTQYELFVARVLGYATGAQESAKEARNAAAAAKQDADTAATAGANAARAAKMAQEAAGSAQGDAERAQRAADRAENFAPPEDGAVVSVNGRGGVVTLTAEDLGAVGANSAGYVKSISLTDRTLTLTFGDGSTKTMQTKDTTALENMTGILPAAHGGTGKNTPLTADDVGAVEKGSGDYLKSAELQNGELVLTFGSGDTVHYTLPAATTTTLGGVKLSDDFTADADGTLHLAGGTAPDPYPVGSIYQSTARTSPAALFGGTWEQIASERVLMGAGSGHAAGTTVEAGLPNITGSFVADVKKGEHKVSGAFTAGSAIASTGEYNSFSDVYKFSLDASKSNAIYGRSATVQPAAYYVHIWRRVA